MKKIIIGSSVFVTLLVGSGATFIYLKNQEISVTNKVNDRKLNIALVNEDAGGVLNGNAYNLGNDFTNLLSKENTNQWTVMTRNVAENRFENGSVDVIVYIEQQFSEKIAQLESFNPDRAKITYKTKSNLDPVKSKNVELRVGEYLNTINQNVIKMYFSSVINNLDDAKRNVDNIVNEQSGTHSKISQYIYGPSNEASQSMLSTLELASNLQKTNSSYEDSQKAFSDSVASLLNNTGIGLEKQLTEVKTYFDFQKDIFEKNVLTTNSTLKEQHEENSKIIDGLNDSVLKSLYQFGNSTDEEKSEQAKLEDLVVDYHKVIVDYQGKIKDRKSEFEHLKTELKEEKKKMSLFYFGKEDVDLKSDLTSDAKATLVDQINKSLITENHLPETYQNLIRSNLTDISIESTDYQTLFSKLEKLNVLTADQVKEYNEKIDLLKNYTKFDKKATSISGLPIFEFLSIENDKLDKVTETMELTVKLPQAESETVEASVTKPSSSLPESSTVVEGGGDSSSSKGTKYLSPKAKIYVTGNATLVGGEQTITDDKLYTMTVEYTLEPHYGKNEISFEVHIGETTIPVKKTIYRSDKEESDVLVKKDLKHILDKLSKIDRTTGMIQAIYGSPSSSSINFSALSPDSVYNMYGNISRDDIATQLSEDQVAKFKESGIALLEQLQNSLESLEKSSDTLPELAEAELPNDYFKNQITNLADWYNNSIKTLSTEYDKWKETKAKQLEVTGTASDANSGILINDSESSNRLYSSIESLVSTTSTGSKETSQNHEAVGTMKDQFTQFVDQVQTIKGNVDKTISTTNDLISNEAEVIQGNRDYAESFKTVMKNIRDGGTTNQNVMNFLSNPIETKKETYEAPISVDNNRVWVILAIILSAISSAGITYWLTKGKGK